MTVTINIGDHCISCGEDTAMGSGRFVNRLGADTEWTIESSCSSKKITVNVDGWICPDCLDTEYTRECDGCDRDIPFDEDCHVDHPELGELYLHGECVKPEWFQFTDDPEYWLTA